MDAVSLDVVVLARGGFCCNKILRYVYTISGMGRRACSLTPAASKRSCIVLHVFLQYMPPSNVQEPERLSHNCVVL
eukprot:12928084-Prorocentrum_lima.AAC.1